jgi:hypothetical protein
MRANSLRATTPRPSTQVHRTGGVVGPFFTGYDILLTPTIVYAPGPAYFLPVNRRKHLLAFPIQNKALNERQDML